MTPVQLDCAYSMQLDGMVKARAEKENLRHLALMARETMNRRGAELSVPADGTRLWIDPVAVPGGRDDDRAAGSWAVIPLPRLALYRRFATRTEPRVAAGSAVNSDTHRSRTASTVIRATPAIRASLVDLESPVRGPSVAPAIRAAPVCGEGAEVARPGGFRHETGMNEIELQRLYEAQLTAQTTDERIPVHDRNAAAAVLHASGRLLGAMLRPGDEHRTWVFSDPHFGHEASVGIFGRPFRSCHHGDGCRLRVRGRGRAVLGRNG